MNLVLYLAETVLPMSAPPIPGGAVRVEGARVTAVGPAAGLPPRPGEEVADLGAALLLPGLINAHCHLDYTRFRGALDPKRGFTEWIKDINALRRAFTSDDYLEAIAEGFALLAAGGATTVANIESFPELLPRLPVPPLRTWWFLELIDVRTRLEEEETLFGALSFFEDHPGWLGGFGLSPHAPYTASVDLYRLARTCAEQHGMPCTTHIGESDRGARDVLPRARAAPPIPRHPRPRQLGLRPGLAPLASRRARRHRARLPHRPPELSPGLRLRSPRPFGASVVHCPKCHTYFGHAPFPLRALRDRGVNICLGTDSLASNNTLDRRSEMREAMARHDLDAREVLEMSTLHAARALGREGELGRIAPGSLADLVAFPRGGRRRDPYEQVVQSHAKPGLLLVNGKRVEVP